jgi:DNA-binding NtrC family response regulator
MEMKILIIDDDSRIRNMFRLWLEREGYAVFDAENGLEGMRILRSSEIDLIVCDLIMPVQEGIETITQVKFEFPNIGIIAISGGGKIGPDSYLSVAEHLGAWRVFTKPIDMRHMIETIQEWGESH